MTGSLGELVFYLEDYVDEICPCDCTLSGWAEWLSKPDPEWNRDAAVADGSRFKASVLRFDEDIVATRGAQGWQLSREPGDAGLVAVRFGQGLGWQADNIVWGEDMGQALREWLAENDAYCDDTEFVAIGINEPSVMITFHAGPPARCSFEVLQ